LPVSGPTILEKTRQLAEVHGLNDFKASDGWLEKCRKRHNISFKSICDGESSAVVDDWKKELPSIIDKYEKRDIFNADKTGLFLEFYPIKLWHLKIKHAVVTGDGKVSKERLTVLLCCNMIGEFERPLVNRHR